MATDGDGESVRLLKQSICRSVRPRPNPKLTPTTLPTLTLHPMPTTLTLEAQSTPSENDLPNPSLRPRPILWLVVIDLIHKDLENLSVSSIINCHHPLCSRSSQISPMFPLFGKTMFFFNFFFKLKFDQM